MNIQEDSYWYVETAMPEEERRVRAMCVACAKQRTDKSGLMHWHGKKGYGNYDLNCSVCGDVIYKRSET